MHISGCGSNYRDRVKDAIHRLIPMMSTLLNADLHLPATVHVDSNLRLQGMVQIEGQGGGEIAAVHPPTIGEFRSDVQLSWVLAHELAHYHELTVRRDLKLFAGSVEATVLWSEYFAERVTWGIGIKRDKYNSPPRPPESSSAAAAPAPQPKGRLFGVGAYSAIWLRAHRDAQPKTWLHHYPAEKWEALKLVTRFTDDGSLDDLFARFPNWVDSDTQTLTVRIDKLLRLAPFSVEKI